MKGYADLFGDQHKPISRRDSKLHTTCLDSRTAAAISSFKDSSIRQQPVKRNADPCWGITRVDGCDDRIVFVLAGECESHVFCVQPGIFTATQCNMLLSQSDQLACVGQRVPIPRLRLIPQNCAAAVGVTVPCQP